MSKLDRYKILINHLKTLGIIESQQDLGRKMGYNNPSAFSQVINGKATEPKQFMQKLKEIYPPLNIEWLENGTETMAEDLKSSPPISETLPVSEGYEVPLIPLLAVGGYLNDFSEGVRLEDCEKIISPIKGVDFAIRIYGDSMEPEYPSGCHVLIKRINEKAYIEWGKAYVLDTCNGTVIKRLMPTDDPDIFSCVSINPEYPPFQIHTEHIFGVYRVLMCMCLK